MRLDLGLLFGVLLCAACSEESSGSADLGTNEPSPSADLAMTEPVMMDLAGPVGTLSLLAGAIGGPGNATNETGADARFNHLESLALDGAGNLYVTDKFNGLIRKVVTATGAVTTLCGSPGNFGVMDGRCTDAAFAFVLGIAADGAGNLYVTDSYTVRKITKSTGMVTTLAGSTFMRGSMNGTGTAALFNGASGVAVDAAGTLYIADTFNHTIRMIVPATGAVTTLAGGSGQTGSTDGVGAAARFNGPYGITADRAGNLYVADSNNRTIRKIVAATGAVTTLAGSGMGGAIDGTGTAASFSSPRGITFDGAGTLYVSDANRIRTLVAATGVVSTLAGDGTPGTADGPGDRARFNYPGGLAADGAGHVYVPDTESSTLRQVDVSSRAVTTLAGAAPVSGNSDGTGPAARFNSPHGLVSVGIGAAYVMDTGNRIVRNVSVLTGAVTTIVGPGAGLQRSESLALSRAGILYIPDSITQRIYQAEVSTGAVTVLAGSGMQGSAEGVGTAASFYNPQGITTDNAGNVYVADTFNNTIRKIATATSTVTTLAGSAGMPGLLDATGTAARFGNPQSVVFDGTGKLYVADSQGAVIRQVSVSTGAVRTICGIPIQPGHMDGFCDTARFSNPKGLALDLKGNLYVSDIGNGTVRKIALGSGVVTTVAGVPGQHGVKLGALPARLNNPADIAVLPTGELLILDENALLVVR